MSDFSNLFYRDPTLGFEQFDNHGRRGALEPERELMLAVLADAIECYHKYGGAPDGIGERNYREAELWIFSPDQTEVFSFLNVCEALQFDPSYIRRGILNLNTPRGRTQALGTCMESAIALKGARTIAKQGHRPRPNARPKRFGNTTRVGIRRGFR